MESCMVALFIGSLFDSFTAQTSWVKDGYCDKACNVSECLFDGGDCLGPNPKMGFGNQGSRK